MIISNTNKGIYFAWRNEDKERKSEIIPFSDNPPYFYIKESAFRPDQIFKNDRWKNSKVYSIRYKEGEWYNLEGEKLTKVICNHPSEIKVVSKEMSENYDTQSRCSISL